MKQYHRGISEAQSNALALARRESTYAVQSQASRKAAWDYRLRAPKSLGHAVFLLRKAAQDEIPGKLHEGSESIGDDGTPRMDAAAVGYIFGRADAGEGRRDPLTGDRPALDFLRTPFRAALADLERQSPPRAAVVRRVAHGETAIAAAIAEGVPLWAARMVADQTLRAFLRTMSDVKVDERGVAAA